MSAAVAQLANTCVHAVHRRQQTVSVVPRANTQEAAQSNAPSALLGATLPWGRRHPVRVVQVGKSQSTTGQTNAFPVLLGARRIRNKRFVSPLWHGTHLRGLRSGYVDDREPAQALTLIDTSLLLRRSARVFSVLFVVTSNRPISHSNSRAICLSGSHRLRNRALGGP